MSMLLARAWQQPARPSAASAAAAAPSPRVLGRCVLVARRSSSSSQNADAPANPPTGVVAQDPLTYKHLLVALIDSNPYLDANSQSAVAAAADLARAHASEKISFVLVDEPGRSSGESAGADASVRLRTVAWHLRERGCETPFDLLERPVGEKGAASALVGDVADEVGADLLLLSSAGVHAGHVDANLLAEFVSCPVLLLP
jgi:hypothetical protein